ncbi:hypothetical protein M9434_004713 [Picochlorum sp. BPE23]|nr:hypothetical protein M9435_002797 [Picochlorum sp. BPE23]KAI8111140.1 hypothetical protein M9434_004713 [Picochlorum sp. BPE23]
MATSLYDSVIYAIVRLSLWGFVTTVACLDGIKNRHTRSKGWQLYFILIGDACLFVIRNCFLLGVAIVGTGSTGFLSRSLQLLYLLSSDLAESAWIFTLLAISSGFCVTRADFGEHKSVCILIPSIFLLTSIVVDFVVYLNDQSTIFQVQKPYDQVQPDPDEYDPDADPLANLDPDTGLIFVFATLVNTMVFFMAWFYMYDTAKIEWESLKEAASPEGEARRQGGDGQQGGPTIPHEYEDDIPVYSSVGTRDRDSLKTIEECVSDREKLLIMKRFFVGVSIYVVASVLVFFLPVFLPHIWEAVILSLYDLILLVFLGSLLYVFRMRQSNQFVLVQTDENDALVSGTTTELGVL